MGIANPGDTLTVTVTGLDTFGHVQPAAKAAWQSASPPVASIAPSAPMQALLTAQTDGLTSIIISAGIASLSIPVGVGQAPPTITIIPMVVNTLVLVTPVGALDAYGMPQSPTSLSYQVANPLLASITPLANGSCVVRALANGITTLRVTSAGGVETDIELEIGQATPIATTIVFSPAGTIGLPNLAPVLVVATVFDQFGNPIVGAPVSWHSSNTQGVLVSSIGALQAVQASAQALITATSGNASASFLAVTLAPAATSIVPSIPVLTNVQASVNGQVVQEGLTTLDQYKNPFFPASVPNQIVISPQGPLELEGIGATRQLQFWRADQYGVADGTVPLLQSTNPIVVNANPSTGLVTELVAGGSASVTATEGVLSSAVTVLTS